MLFYDYLNPEEEEEFFDLESRRCRRELNSIVDRLLDNDPTLTEILIDFELEDQDLQHLIHSISNSGYIQKLTVRNWSFGDTGTTHFANLLRQNTHRLHELTLQTCGITCTGASLILSSLHQNGALKKLNLSNNKNLGLNVRHDDLEALKNAVRRARGISELNLSGTPMDTQCFEALIDGLQKHPSIRSLNVSWRSSSIKISLEILSPYLPSLKLHQLILTYPGSPHLPTLKLHRLILTHHGSRTIHVTIPPRILKKLSVAMNKNKTLCFLGPLEKEDPIALIVDDPRLAAQSKMDLAKIHHILDVNCFRRDDRNVYKTVTNVALWPHILSRMRTARLPESLIFHSLREKADLLFPGR